MNHGKREFHSDGVHTTAPPQDSPILRADTSGSIDPRTDNVPLIQDGTLAKALMALMVIVAVVFGTLYVLFG